MTRRMMSDLRIFLVIWFSQTVSQLGSQLTSFALGVWVYTQTGSVTDFALIMLFATLPGVLLAPFLGVLADRWNRRLVMMLSDSGSAAITLMVALLLATGRLELWHIYLAAAIGSILSALQMPALMASIPLLIPKEHLGRANGFLQISASVNGLLGPVLAGALVVTIGVYGVMLIDFATFLFAVTAMFFIRIPQPAPSDGEGASEGSFLRQVAYSWIYLRQRMGLLGLFLLFATTNFLAGTLAVLVTPLVLTFATPDVLGLLLSAGGAGMLIGSLTMGSWGGPKRRIYGVIGFVMLEGVSYMIAGLRPSALLFGLGLFIYNFALMIDDGCYVSILQSKVAQDVQGRLFAVNHMITKGSLPLAYLLAGPLADRVFGPMLNADGALAGTGGLIIGRGHGRGMGLMFIIAGVLTIAVATAAYLYPRIRLIETELPDTVSSAQDVVEEADQMGAAAPA
jgi:MFS transporter, DHA3 family, macrolide efflux protein